jgi:hypothetical protein
MRRAFVLALALVALGGLAPANAATIVFNAPLQPEGGAGSTGTGEAWVTFDTVTMSMRVQVWFSGTSGFTTASHVHCCTTTPGVGNAGVATQLPSFTGFPLNVQSGTYDHTFDMSLAASWNSSFVTANGGSTASAFTALVNGLSGDRGYLNIHTTTFSGGEIRARLAVVPEPGTLALLALGVGVLAAGVRARG